MHTIFSINPLNILEMAGVGYLLAIAVHILLSLWYSRLGRNVLLRNDRWTAAYFLLTGVAWIVAAAFAVYETIPLVPVWNLPDFYKVASVFVLFLIFMLFRNRNQQPLQQSLFTTFFFSLCIIGGAYLGCLGRFKTMYPNG